MTVTDVADGGYGGAIGFAEKLLVLLDEGSFTATYKFAVILALIDTCLEHAGTDGSAPTELTPRQLAEKTVELYWPHTGQFPGTRGPVVLRQNRGGQAAILSAISSFRTSLKLAGPTPIARARILNPSEFDRLLEEVAWKLIQMPLPRLQVLGAGYDPFLYEIDWDEHVRRGDVSSGNVDTTVRLQPEVGDHLIRLSGLVRPLVQRHWTRMVADLNRTAVPEAEHLDAFLFGAERLSTARLRGPLADLQGGRCFYCDQGMGHRFEVDHFVPWSRHPDDGLDNLVAAHANCNNSKRDFLAAAEHVETWSRRFEAGRERRELDAIATQQRWLSRPSRTLSVARAIYLRLPDDARLWVRSGTFTQPHWTVLTRSLVASSGPMELAAEDQDGYEPN